MPTANNDDVSLYYEVDGDGPTVAFVNEVGLGAWLWGWQHPAVAGPYEALVWDLRGTGRSDEGALANYTVDAFATDLEAVLGDYGARRAHLVGAGLGGMVALRYAREFNRATSLTLFGTAASGAWIDKSFGGLFACRSSGSGEASEGHADARDFVERNRTELQAVFSEKFLADRPDLIGRIVEWRREEDAELEVTRAQIAAAKTFKAGPLYELTLPALVFHGVDDQIVPVEAGRALAEDLPRGQFKPVEGRHLPFVEHAAAVNDELVGFLDETEEQ